MLVTASGFGIAEGSNSVRIGTMGTVFESVFLTVFEPVTVLAIGIDIKARNTSAIAIIVFFILSPVSAVYASYLTVLVLSKI